MILLIRNCVNHHYECIESVIVKHQEIIKVNADIIYLEISNHAEPSFKKYILEKYPNIIYGSTENYDYFIDVTVYKKPKLLESKKKFYISHDPNNSYLNMKNVYYASPFYKRNIVLDILPFTDQINTNKFVPIYIIQGNKSTKDNKPTYRRDFNLLDSILNSKYNYKFIIRWNGQGILPSKYNIFKEKGLLEETSGDFIEYHKHFLDCYCIIPLISRKNNPDYYSKKLTSSINYIKGYKLKCLIDKDLQQIYKLEDVEIYNDKNDISLAFEKTLKDFYVNK